jgi:hypothetical protein
MPTASDDDDDLPPLGCADWVLLGLVVGVALVATGWWFVTLMESSP